IVKHSFDRLCRIDLPLATTRDEAGPANYTTASGVARGRAGAPRRRPVVSNAEYFSRTIVKEPGRAAGRATHPEFRVALQPSPFRVVPSSVPVTSTDRVAPSEARKTPSLASRQGSAEEHREAA